MNKVLPACDREPSPVTDTQERVVVRGGFQTAVVYNVIWPA